MAIVQRSLTLCVILCFATLKVDVAGEPDNMVSSAGGMMSGDIMKTLTENGTLKEVLCVFLGGCETTNIIIERQEDRLTIKLELSSTSVTLKSGCEKTIVDLYNWFVREALAKKLKIKEFLIALFATPELLSQLSSEQCSFYHAEVELPNGVRTFSCDGRECVTFKASKDGTAFFRVQNMSLRFEQNSSLASVDADFKFDFRTLRVPKGSLDVRYVSKAMDDVLLRALNEKVTAPSLERGLRGIFDEEYANDVSLWDIPPPHKIRCNSSEFSHLISNQGNEFAKLFEINSTLNIECPTMKIFKDSKTNQKSLKCALDKDGLKGHFEFRSNSPVNTVCEGQLSLWVIIALSLVSFLSLVLVFLRCQSYARKRIPTPPPPPGEPMPPMPSNSESWSFATVESVIN